MNQDEEVMPDFGKTSDTSHWHGAFGGKCNCSKYHLLRASLHCYDLVEGSERIMRLQSYIGFADAHLLVIAGHPKRYNGRTTFHWDRNNNSRTLCFPYNPTAYGTSRAKFRKIGRFASLHICAHKSRVFC